MASPTTAAAPDAPSGSSPLSINGLPRLVGWFVEIVNFIKSLSPSGGVYDTGWIDCTPVSAGFTGACRARRQGKTVEVRFDYSVTPSVASAAYFAVANLPSGIAPPSNGAAFGMARVTGSPLSAVPAYVTVGGVLSYINTTSAAKTTLAGSVMYMVG